MRAYLTCGLCLLVLAANSRGQAGPSADSARALLTEGKQLYIQEGPKAALLKFERALDIFHSNKERQGEAITLGYIANCQRKLGNLDQALEYAQKALHMKEELGDRGEAGNTHNQLGLIYWERSDYPNAIQHLNRAIEIASSVGDRELEGSARNNLGLVYDERGDYKDSLEQYQHALELHRATHFERGEGDTLGNIGGVYLLLGKYREAIPYYRQALKISERLGLKPASSDDLGNIALCLAGMGDADASLENFDRAAQVAREAGLAKEEADWHKGKGTTLVGFGRYDAALHEYATAERVYEHSGLERELVEELNDVGVVYESLGDVAAAEIHFHRALRIAQKIGNDAGESTSRLALGDLERRRKQNKQAETYFQSALTRAEAAGDEGTVAAALIQLGRNNLDRKRYDSAGKEILDAHDIAERLGNRPALAQSHYVMAEVRRSQADFPQAFQEYAAAQTLQEELRDPELGWRILFGRGQALEAQGKSDEAVDSYKGAIDIIEKTRSQIFEDRFRAGYMEDRYQVYVALVELLLKLGQPADAFFYSEKLRARAYFDQVSPEKSGGLNDDAQHHMEELARRIGALRHAVEKEYALPEKQRSARGIESYSIELGQAEKDYQDLLDSAGSGNHHQDSGPQMAPSAAEIQPLLPADTALLEFVVGKQSVTELLMTSHAIFGLPIRVSSEALFSRTELLRGLITQRSPQWSEPATGLFRLLMAPLQTEGRLHGIRQVVIIPDSVLNYVPFAALPTGRGKFLGDEYEIAYLPAAAALMTKSPENQSWKLLAVAPSEPQLRNTTAEVRSIGALFSSSSRILSGKQATETLFKQAAGDYAFLHLATHGGLNRNAPFLSALQLEADAQNDGRLELHEIASLKLHARLVTLSACETALGSGYFTETPAGDEFVGMTRAFLGAGSQSVLASLWAVNDESTRILMVKFYRHLLRMGGAKALAQAQREIRNSSPRYRHPYYWAPFVIVGSTN